MPDINFNWKRYWCPREGAFNLSDGGYLVDPEGEYGHFFAEDVRPYKDISTTPCLVLLGEPGIGKTTALEEIYLSESENYQTVRLDLGEFSSDDRLFRHFIENEPVKAWRDGSHILSVLLDSLDECRVANIAKVLSCELARMPTERLRLRIACRTAVWPITLEEALNTAWGKDNFGVYELAPLSRKDVAEAATQSGIPQDEFLHEIAHVHAQPLAIKPISLKFLLNQYQANRCLPAEEAVLYLKGCFCLCEESQERQDAGIPRACDAAQRFVTAQRIAYITIFSGKFAVWTGPQDSSMPAEDLSISDLLGIDMCNGHQFDVNEAVVRDTLNTGLFTARGAYRMGWAHQTYAEFLASQYLLSRLDAKQRWSLLFLADPFGSDVVPQLTEVAARLASSDDTLFQKILETAPNVLLRSDVSTADYAQRAALLSAILTKCEAKDIHFFNLDHAGRLQYLDHPGIVDQLRPFVKEDTRGRHARVFALDTFQACGVDGLRAELLSLALDRTADIGLRCRALRIIGERVDPDTATRIRPLVEDSPEDPDFRIKGHVLRALWPEFLSAEELFRLLTPKQRNHLMTAYDMFISHEIYDTLRPEDMPAALAWVKAQGRRYDLDLHFKRLLDGVLIVAWNQLDEPGVLPMLAEALGKRLTVDHGHIMDGTEFKNAGFLSGERKRHLLLTQMVSKVDDVDDGTFHLSSRCANIAKSSDFGWLIDKAVSAVAKAEAEAWARLCRWNYNINSVSETEAVLDVYNVNIAMRNQFAPLLEPITLDSPQAHKLKEEHDKYSAFDRDQEQPPLLDPAPAIRVQRLLDRCEAGEPRLWWCVARELSLEPRSCTYWSATI